MRQRISFAFYCLASVVILLQLATSVITLNKEKSQQQLLHSVTTRVEKPTEVVESMPQIDYKKLALDLEAVEY